MSSLMLTHGARRLTLTFAATVVSIGTLAVAASAPAAAATAHPQKQVTVTEHVGVEDTGMDVVLNQKITVSAITDGQGNYDKIASGCWFWAANGPEGTDSCGGTLPMASARAYSLLASVDGQRVYVGRGATFMSPGTGRLRLEINDNVRGNGSGSFRANVSTTAEVAKTVPNVMGWDGEMAKAKLRNAGFTVYAAYGSGTCAQYGRVMYQSIPGGTKTFATQIYINIGTYPYYGC